jgi:hypothetical protein
LKFHEHATIPMRFQRDGAGYVHLQFARFEARRKVPIASLDVARGPIAFSIGDRYNHASAWRAQHQCIRARSALAINLDSRGSGAPFEQCRACTISGACGIRISAGAL